MADSLWSRSALDKPRWSSEFFYMSVELKTMALTHPCEPDSMERLTSMEQLSVSPKVVRLGVEYRSAQSLVSEYTASLERGGCLLASRKAVDVGSRFLLEMGCAEAITPLEIEGEVVRVRAIYGTSVTYELTIHYRTSVAQQQAAVDATLAMIGVDQSFMAMREFPRIPVNLSAEDGLDQGRRYLIRDVSRGGMRIEQKDGAYHVDLGTRIMLGVRLQSPSDPFIFIGGTVRWQRAFTRARRTHFGVQFDDLGQLSASQAMVIDDVARLYRPFQVVVHLGEPLLRNSQRVFVVDGRRRLRFTEVMDVMSEIGRHELSVTLGLHEASLPEPSEQVPASIVARIGLTGDLDGELRLIASVELCAAIATQIGEDLVSVDDLDVLTDALREFLVGLGGSLCDRWDAAGYEVETTDPLLGEVAAPVAGEQVHTLTLSGAHGVATIEVVCRP